MHALYAIKTELLRLKWQLAALRFERAMHRHALALKYGRADQLRDERGRWADEGGGQRIRLAGEIPSGGLPQIPEKRPGTAKERNLIVKQVAKALLKNAGPIGKVVSAGSWLYEHRAEIQSYLDAPKSLQELQDAASEPNRAGYQKHHIVEQGPARGDGFPDSMVDGSDNLTSIPVWKHRDITSWYQTNNPAYGGLSPRDYLRDKTWEERRAMGLKALTDFGVLKP